MIVKIKNEIIKLIANKTEVTCKTNYNTSGIYMFYIDNFDDNKIIPFYIGRAENFQDRYKQHLEQLMTLNRFKYKIYKEMFFNNYYNGAFKSCKVFQYMVDHNCTLKDFRMIILDEQPKEKLVEKELEYIRKYNPEFFGFNQINTISYKPVYDSKVITNEQYWNLVLEDSYNIKRFYKYGYTKTNYFLSFFHETVNNQLIFDDNTKEKINKNIKELAAIYNVKRFDKYYKLYYKLSDIEKELDKQINQIELELRHICRIEITNFFRKYNIDVKYNGSKYKQMRDCIIYDSNYYNECKRYFKSKNINENIIDILKEKDEIKSLKKQICEINTRHYKIKKLSTKLLHIETYWSIRGFFPKRKYDSYPLKDKYEDFLFDDSCYNGKDNICYLNIEFSNCGRSFEFNTEPIKVDYLIKIDNTIIERKNLFLHSDFDNFFEQENHVYVEKGLRKFRNFL